MARLYQTGFELNSVTSGVELRETANSPTISSTTMRTGSYALQISSLSSGASKYGRLHHGSTGAPVYIRFYFYYTAAPSADNTIFRNATISPYIAIKISSTGTLKLFDEDGQIGSASSALSTSTWYRIEVEYNVSGAGGTHTAKARIDGTEFAAATNRTTGGSDSILLGGNLLSEAQTTGAWFFDDVAINDNTGSYQNSYPGEGKIVHLKPNANGTTNSWTIGAGSGSNYEQVDEVTPDEATTYLRSLTTNAVDEYAIEAFPGNSYDTINCIAVGFRATRSAGTNSSGMKVRIRSGSSVETAATEELATNGSFRTNDLDSTNAGPYSLVSYVSPATSTAWTPTEVDSAEIGAIIVTSGDRYVHLGTIWASVDYATGTPPSSSSSKLGLLGVG